MIEVSIATMILVGALAGFITTLGRTQKTEEYSSERTKALDALRIAAAEFSRDARQAKEIIAGDTDSVEFDTYSSTEPDREVRTIWQVYDDGNGSQLRRIRCADSVVACTAANGAVRVFVVDLTSDTVFTYAPTSTSPGDYRRIQLFMSTQPLANYPDIDLATEVTLRNVE